MDELELIKQKINVVDLIQEYLPLKKSGVNFKTACPFHNEKTPSFMVSPERQIWHCFGCFPPGEMIKTPFGYHNIEEIDKNHWVVSGKGNLRQVTDIMVHQYKGDLVEVITRKLGDKVRLTADHNVFVVRGAKYTRKLFKNFSKRYKKYLKFFRENPDKYYKLTNKYFPIEKIPAGQLEVGDKLLYPVDRSEKELETIDLNLYLTKSTRLGPVPQNMPMIVPITEDFLKLIGYYIAEGSNHRAYIRFSLGNHEEKFAQEIINLIKNIFGLKAQIYRRSGTRTGIEVTTCHAKLANIFENLCGKGADNKHIPFIFQGIPAVKQRIIIEAIFKGDGHNFVANRSTKVHKSITTISKVLAEQIVDILLRLDYFPSKRLLNERIDKKGVNHKIAYSIFWSEEATQKYKSIYYHPDGSEYWLLPITNISRQKYNGPVHNFTVAYDHSYIATNFAVGNCQKGGDIFKFVMEKEGMEFKEALEFLAKKAGITLARKSSSQKNTTDRLFEANLKAQQFFEFMLTSHHLGKKALEYLHKRGLTDETIKAFGLGYAPLNWESLSRFLKKRGFSEGDITAAGLGVISNQGCYDRFRGRVIYPLIDTKNRIIGFAGRILGVGEPKYINTPQTHIFDKSKFLFGLDKSKGEIKQSKEAIIVEGEMDMIASYQSGVKNIVASKGTALTEDQIELLKRYAETINLCFDADLAGDSASRRGIEMADKQGLNIKVIQIAGAKDPADLCLADPKVWKEAVEKSVPIYDYYLDSVARRYDIKSASGKKSTFAELLPIWQTITDPMVKEHYIQKLSLLLAVKDDLVRQELKRVKTSLNTRSVSFEMIASNKDEQIPPRDRRKLLEEYLIALMLHLPKDITYVPNFPETLFTQENLRQIYVLLVLWLDSISFKGKAFKVDDFAKSVPSRLVDWVDKLYLIEIDEKLLNSSAWQKELNLVISELKKMLIKASLEKLSLEIKQAQSFDKVESLEVLNKRFRDLSVKLKNL